MNQIPNNSKKVLFAGGGTMGSVSPLLAIHQELQQRDSAWESFWIGTQEGPEKEVIEQYEIPFYTLPSVKLRRYFSLKNLIEPFRLMYSIHKAKKVLKEINPSIVLTAGSFIAYPVAKAASKLNIPVFIHQQDIVKGLANKMMEKYSSVNTITFDQSLNDFDINKTYYTSNPVRKEILECDDEGVVKEYNLDPERKTILIMGGGTGAMAINQLTLEALGELTKKYQIIHLTGKDKSIVKKIPDYYTREEQLRIRKHYHPYDFIEEGMCKVLRHASLVISRAGLSSLTELSVLEQPTLVIPIPDSHQEANAQYFAKYNAIKLLDQKTLTGEKFAQTIIQTLESRAALQNLSRNISQMIDPKAAKRYVDLIYKYLELR